MKRSGIIAGSIIFILMALYNTLIFCLTKNFTTSFWIGYIFIMLSMLIMLISFVICAYKEKLVGLPLNMLSLYYFVLELILGSCLMFFDIPFIAAFLPQMIVFLIFLMIYVPAILRYFSKEENKSKKV